MRAPDRSTRARLAAPLLAAALLPALLAPGAPAHAAPTQEQVDAAAQALSESSAAMVQAVAALGAAEAELGPARDAATTATAAAGAARGTAAAATAAHRAAEAAVLRAAAALDAAREGARHEDDELARLARAAYIEGPAPVGWLLASGTPAELRGRVEVVRRAVAAQRAAADAARADADVLAAGEGDLAARRDAAVAAADAARTALADLQAREAEAAAALARVDRVVREREAALAAARAAQEEDAVRWARLQAEAEATRTRLARAAVPAGPAAVPLVQGAADGDTSAVPGALALPVDAPVTSPYGMRTHPITGVHKLHTGTDLGAPCGTPVVVAAPGTVVEAGTVGGYGQRVVVAHAPVGPDGVRLSTTYSHLSRTDVREGDALPAGRVVGLVGSTGFSTGCHLHLEVLAGDDYVDPAPWFGLG
ncbi:M23 family metallopeptidase [Vallicoccus soli]|uniref:M23 family metallopeptidase n=1 Tax=Vallicoccus soli TaxID=2339232 RepID=A0A3A3Z1K8_9ACTN|nr:M23 family metallopeptidase [Vallicoccus soli]RJK98129.1 M23 family metallopeptidase [Vallicoccus soli]